MRWLMDKIYVNIPFTMLYESYLDRFISNRLNPEIGLDAVALERFSLSEFRDIAEQLHSNNLRVTFHAPFMDLSPGSPDPAVREVTRRRFEQVIRLVPLFHPKKVVCHAAYDHNWYGNIRDLWIENSLETWSWMGRCIVDEGSQLILENVFEHHPDDIRILFDRLNHLHVKFCLDTGHQAAFSRTSLKIWLHALGDVLGHLHLHDNNGEHDDHLAMGRGTIDFKTFFNELKTIRSTPPSITIEPHREEDLWPSFEYLATVWPWENGLACGI
jgi:sugar phosphate isomerase/epimerase